MACLRLLPQFLLTFTHGSRIFDSLNSFTCVVFPHLSTPSRRMNTPLLEVAIEFPARMSTVAQATRMKKALRLQTRKRETSARFVETMRLL